MPTVEGQFIDLPGRGLRLHYRDWGGSGPPILLLHGLSSNTRIWDWTAPLLTDRFRVIALDQRGHGPSDVPESGYGFDETVPDVVAFIEARGLDRPIVVGHSWGASVALALGVEHPEHTRGVVMVDGGLIELSRHRTWAEAERDLMPPELDGIPVESFVKGIRQWQQAADWSDELGEMVLANFAIRDEKVYRRLPIPLHMQIARAIYEMRPSDLLPKLTRPALAISCELEPTEERGLAWQTIRREGIERARSLAPTLEVVVMADTVHDVPIQRPRELADLTAGFAAPLS